MADFSIRAGQLGKMLSNFKKQERRSKRELTSVVNQGIKVAYRIARTKRAMITNAQAKAEGRKKLGKGKYKRVSDPNAPYGVPVDTGTLRASIRLEEAAPNVLGTKVQAKVWTELRYAKYVEKGTSRMQARPFMQPARLIMMESVKRLVEKYNNKK